MNLQIKEISSKRELKDFISLPWKIYKDDHNWVPPLRLAIKELLSPKHPFYETGEIKLFIAIKNNQVVGRIAAIINNTHNKFWNEKVGFWGFFEAVEEQSVAKSLFNTAENWVKTQGMDKIRGPVNPSTNYECGLLVNGHDDFPQIMMTYNPTYYSELLEQQGYKKIKDLLAYQIDLSFNMPEKITKISNRIEKSKRITYRQISKKNWAQEVQTMLEIYNEAWERNWGFIPMTKNEFIHTANELKQVVDEKLIMFVLVEGKEAGFIVCLPDFNQVFKKIPTGKLLPTGIFKLLRAKQYINRVRVITMGVKEKHRNLGLASLLYHKMHQNLKDLKYAEAEMSWILEDNIKMNRPLQVMGAKPYKTYRIFEKSI